MAIAWVTIELYAYFGVAALLGIIMYYWTRAIVDVRRRKLATIYANLGIEDVES